jgi:glucosamine-6-phosphate deaminase
MYASLLDLFQKHPALDLSGLITFNLDEYYPVAPSDQHSYRYEMDLRFFHKLQYLNPSFQPVKQTFIPSGEPKDIQQECERYELKIKKYGGIDLQILGIGTNGHIGFNEPPSDNSTRTRLVGLAEETILVNATKFFDGDKTKMPRQALSMGVGTILEAKEVFLLASGPSKKDIMQRLSDCQETTPDIPASYLLTHAQVSWFVDEEAWFENKSQAAPR